MNVNQRELNQHVEFEPNSYYAAFSAELEASAYPMWALVSHLRGPESTALSQRVITFCVNALQDWLDAVNFTHPNIVSSNFAIRVKIQWACSNVFHRSINLFQRSTMRFLNE